MRELLNDPFFNTFGKYPRCIIEYCLIEDEIRHRGFESHKCAVLFAMIKAIERYLDHSDLTELVEKNVEFKMCPWSLDMEKTKGRSIDTALFLETPKIVRRDRYTRLDVYDLPSPDVDAGERIPYWYTFLKTPHTTGYRPEDFTAVNAALFPAGTDELEVYEWTTDWSSYFDEGHEWWGAACWSVYDKQMNRYVVILASTTD